MTYTLTGALAEITAALPKVVLWRKLPPTFENAANAFEGNADGWHFLIVTWWDVGFLDRQEQRTDGTATKVGLVIRLTPELAKLAGDLATKEQS